MELALKMTKAITWRASNARYRTRELLRRVRRGWRYVRGTLTKDDASAIGYDVMHIEGDYPLAYITVDDVLMLAQDRWGDDPRLDALAQEATRRVWNKWSSSGDELSAAQDWAMELIEEYARNDGITLNDLYAPDVKA